MENNDSTIKTKVKQDAEFIWPVERLREFTAFKLTKSEHEKLVQAAKAKGLSVSEYIRQALASKLSGAV
jgi:predicted HicB family RNase H-like nuclease